MPRIEAQPGFQEEFLKSKADIAVGGGSAGAGKSFALLMEAGRNVGVEGYNAVLFRRTSPQIRQAGGLWDTSTELYTSIGGEPHETFLEWRFGNESKIKFAHLQYEKDKISWQGAQIAMIGFDELTHFSQTTFDYLLSRNRTMCGIKPYIRATCNPDPDSWVAKFLSWWIDQDQTSPTYGLAIPERAGVIRWFARDAGNYVWGDTPEEVVAKCPHIFENEALKDIKVSDLVKSVTFIPGTIHDNAKLLKKDPAYLSNLLAQDDAMVAQLYRGNWKVRIDGNDLINLSNLRNCYTNKFVEKGLKYITADIALHGSDRFVVAVWSGWRLIDLAVMEKSEGDEVIKLIEQKALQHSVPQSNIVYDADGVGAYLRGFLRNARAFKNGSKPFRGENFFNLKTQCAYKLAEIINDDLVYISPLVASMKFDSQNVTEIFEDERRCLKRLKPDDDGKLRIITKPEMKNILGRSPDFLDALIMRAYFDVRRKFMTM